MSAQLVARLETSVNVPTAADGSFAIPIGAWLAVQRAEFERGHRFPDAPPNEVRMSSVLGMREGEFDVMHAGRMASIRVPPGMTSDVSVGDVVLSASQRMASGRVVDDRGEPAPGATVEAISAPAGGLAAVDAQDGLVGSTTTRADGRFDVYAWSDATRLVLSAGGEGYAESEWAEATRGAEGVVLVLPRAGRVRGEVLTDPGTGLFDVDVRATARSSGLSTSKTEPEIRDADLEMLDGRFELSDLAAGRWALVLHRRIEGSPLCDAIEFEVAPGETVELDPIDMRGRTWSTDFDVVDPEGEPVAQGSVFLMVGVRSGHRGWDTFSFENGRVKIATLTLEEPERILVSVPGLREAEIDPRSVPAVVALERGFVVTIQLGLPQTLPSGVCITASLSPRRSLSGDRSLFSFARDNPTPDADGILRFDVGAPGIHSLALIASHSSGGRGERINLPDELRMFRIEDGPHEQSFSLAVPQDALASALRQIGL